MINDLDESLKELLLQKGSFKSNEVDISFEIPTREWSAPVTQPTINIYLYDIRENRQLRETYWDDEPNGSLTAMLKRRPLRVDLSYMITCWTSALEDQHHLLWQALEIFFRHSPLPEEILQGKLRDLQHPIPTQIAQSDGVLKSITDFWGGLDNQLRPGINLVVTLELDLDQIDETPYVFARMLKVGRPNLEGKEVKGKETERILEPGWEVAPIHLGGFVRDQDELPVEGVAVRLLGKNENQQTIQHGPTRMTDAEGKYSFTSIASGDYTLVAEFAEETVQHPLTLTAGGRGEVLPEFVRDIKMVLPVKTKKKKKN